MPVSQRVRRVAESKCFSLLWREGALQRRSWVLLNKISSFCTSAVQSGEKGGIPITVAESIFLGVVQGVAEFLPISSSGHLVFFQSVFGFKEPPVFFDVLLHLGTLLAVVVFFRTDILTIAKGLAATWKGKKVDQQGSRLFLWIVIASLPTGLMGVLFKDWFESLFSQPKTVGFMLIITGLFLWVTRYAKGAGRTVAKMRWADAVIIGIAQGIAIIPGISRSGATISTGLSCGLDRELSGKFSFLLSIPAILGATLLELRKFESGSEFGIYLIGMAIAFGAGLFFLKLLMKIIKIGKISNFSYYCAGVGALMILLT